MCTSSTHDAGALLDSEQTEQRWSVNDILRQFGPAYLNKFQDRMSLDQIKALKALSSCRSQSAGSVIFRCLQCSQLYQVPKSCGNRHCPTCQGAKALAWLEEQQARLLPCHYFMLTFTVPAEFRAFMRSHPKECYQAIFQAAYHALTVLARDPRHLGSERLGMTGVLHTWGRDLNYHPHVHFIVPGGAISDSGDQWLPSRNDFLLPVLALSKIYRAKFKDIMDSAGLLDAIDPVVWTKAWNVNSQAVGDGRDSLRYLAPYVFRVAIGNHRISAVEQLPDGSGRVTFMVKPSHEKHYRPMTVTAEEFIRRFLQHVLPTGFQKVRHFGFLHKRSRVAIVWLAMLVTVTLNMVYVLNATANTRSLRPVFCCERCGGQLVYVCRIAPCDSINIDSS